MPRRRLCEHCLLQFLLQIHCTKERFSTVTSICCFLQYNFNSIVAQHSSQTLSATFVTLVTWFSSFQALWTQSLSFGQQGVFSDPKFLLLPLHGCRIQPVSSSRHVQGLSFASDGRHASLLPAGGEVSSAPLHSPAFRPSDRSADAGEPRAGACHSGSRGGDERAGETCPAGEVHHQNHPVCFPIWVLEKEGGNTLRAQKTN